MPRKVIFAFFASCGVAHYRGLRFAPPSAKSHSLRSGIRPFRSCCGIGCGKQVIISLSEAVLWVGSGTPHRSLRSLCVVLTINQPLRGCAAIIAAEAADFQ